MADGLAKIRGQLAQVSSLRGAGPVSPAYGQWVDATRQLLGALFGTESLEANGFLEIVGEGAEARGWGLPLAPANPWGMRARLERAERYLHGLCQRIEHASYPAESRHPAIS